MYILSYNQLSFIKPTLFYMARGYMLYLKLQIYVILRKVEKILWYLVYFYIGGFLPENKLYVRDTCSGVNGNL